MEDELTTRINETLPVIAGEVLSRDQMVAQVRTVQEVMKTVMKDGEHYGVIPGCGNKPTLLKPGAEKLLHTFGFAPRLKIEDMFPHDDDKVGYRIICQIYSRDERFMGEGAGEASSEEMKWKWREVVCQEEWDETLDDARRKKWKKAGESILQVRTNPYDLSNTILKMAEKRAKVDATLTVCACSDIFGQDLEELPDHVKGGRTASKVDRSKKAAPTRTERCAPHFGFRVTEGCADKPLVTLTIEQLEGYAEAVLHSVNNPDRARYKASNEQMLGWIEEEINSRTVETLQGITVEEKSPSEDPTCENAAPVDDLPIEAQINAMVGLIVGKPSGGALLEGVMKDHKITTLSKLPQDPAVLASLEKALANVLKH